MSAPVLFKAATRELRPWKNGGGRTSEVVSFPFGSGMDEFWWRISIADVDADGPFSIFPMVERHVVILAGTLCLRFDDRDRVMSAGDAPFSFSGSSPVMGNPVGGPVRDLNLMVKKDRYDGQLRIVGQGYSQATSSLTVAISLQAATVMVDDAMLELNAEDALLLSGPANIESASTLILADLQPLS